MGFDRYVDKAPDRVSEQLRQIKEQLKDVDGLESAEISFEKSGIGLVAQPVVKSLRLRTDAIESVAHADPSNIQQVAASQLEISNSYYQSVLAQARRSFGAAIAAGSIGLAFFLAAVALVLTQDSLSAAVVTTLGGAIVEVISGLNFWLYGRAARQLDAFHVRLEQTQRFLLANSVCSNLDGEARTSSRVELVRLIASYKVPAAEHEA